MENFVMPGNMHIADTFNKRDLEALLKEDAGPCISVYLPTHRSGKETRQNATRFKNAMDSVQELVPGLGTEPFIKLMNDTPFWQHQKDGFAMFISPDTLNVYRLPKKFPEVVVGADQFHLKPVLPLVVYDTSFFILALSQNECRLFKCSMQDCREIRPKNLPDSLAQALRFDLQEKQLQFHTAGPEGSRPGRKAASFHGHGTNDDEDKDRILRYFQAIDRPLTNFLGTRKDELILAGVDYLHPLYKRANSYPHLLDEGITGNPETLKIEDLHAAALKIVEPRTREDLDRAVRQYHDLKGTGKAANDLGQIIQEALAGRISQLILSADDHKWGKFTPDAGTVALHSEKQPEDQDLLNMAACHAMRNGASVFPVPGDEMPDDSAAAAVFHY